MRTITNTNICQSCLRHPPAFDQAWASAQYCGILQQLVPLYKFHGKTALRKTFAHIIFQFLERYNIPLIGDAIIPVPLTPLRFRERGYNQSQLLAEIIARKFNIPLLAKTLKRPHQTPRQSALGRKERFTNINSAFTIISPSALKNKRIILVDDLLTTGATASEAAKTLKANGAASVTVIVLAAA